VLGKAGAGVLAAAYPAGALVGSIPSGVVAARLGVKPTVLAGMTVVAITTALFGFAGTAWELDLARFLQGVASSFSGRVRSRGSSRRPRPGGADG